jgi:hypothetical protein
MEKYLIAALVTIFVGTSANAQNQSAILGQPSQIRFAIPNVTNLDKCHIEVNLPNQQKIAIDVDGPQFNAEVNFTPEQIGSTTIKWEGKRKNRGLNSVSSCPGSGLIQITVKGNTELIAQQWNQYFAKVPEPIGECVKVGMDFSQLKYQVLADPNAVLTAPDDQRLKPIYEKCEAFAKQNQPRKGAPCTLASQNNLSTTCDGVYAEKQPDGRLKPITRAAAIQLQFEGKPWTIGVVENSDARATRLKQEEEQKNKQAVAIAAQKEAEERDRKIKESPEYKKQQAEIERKKLAAEQEAALNAKKAQEESERQRAANERAEKERAQKQEAERVAQKEKEDKQRAEDSKPKVNSSCNQSDKSRFYVLDIWGLVSGSVTTTEVSILAKGKKVCFSGVATGRNDGTNTTEAVFENNRVSCTQSSDADRLAAAKIRKTGYRVVGEFSGVAGRTVMLKNCSIESM